MTPSAAILVVDDDPDTRSNLCDILELDHYRIETAGTATEVLKRKDWSRISAVLLDRRLPDGNAEELLPRLRQLAPDTAVLIVTGYADLQDAIAALRQGAADYILKPINPDALRASLARLAEQRRLTLAKERSETAFRTLVEAAPCLIVILRRDYTIAYFSPFAEELTGYRAGELLGVNYIERFLCDECEAMVREHLQQVLAGTPARGFENPVRCRDETRRWFLWNAQRLADYEGAPAILKVGQDITALKQAQERTLQAERLAAIGQMMAGLAHESGNALARSQACLEMLTMEVEDRPEALDLVGRLQKAQNHLQQLYGEVRNYAAPLKLDRQKHSVRSIWRQAWANLSDQRHGRTALLQEECEGVDPHCLVDAFRLEQVFRNILSTVLQGGHRCYAESGGGMGCVLARPHRPERLVHGRRTARSQRPRSRPDFRLGGTVRDGFRLPGVSSFQTYDPGPSESGAGEFRADAGRRRWPLFARTLGRRDGVGRAGRRRCLDVGSDRHRLVYRHPRGNVARCRQAAGVLRLLHHQRTRLVLRSIDL
jgi:two-component system sensor kinase FixL